MALGPRPSRCWLSLNTPAVTTTPSRCPGLGAVEHEAPDVHVGGFAPPYSFDPQQATVPSVRTPQLYSPPFAVDTLWNVPVGGGAMPPLKLPQQATVRSVRHGGGSAGHKIA
jgi:hypothetical protein